MKADEKAAIKQAEEKARLKAEAEANQKAAEESMKAVFAPRFFQRLFPHP